MIVFGYNLLVFTGFWLQFTRHTILKRTTICGQDSQDGGAPKVLVVAIIVVMVTIVIVHIISTNGERAKRCQKSLKNSWHTLNITILKSDMSPWSFNKKDVRQKQVKVFP